MLPVALDLRGPDDAEAVDERRDKYAGEAEVEEALQAGRERIGGAKDAGADSSDGGGTGSDEGRDGIGEVIGGVVHGGSGGTVEVAVAGRRGAEWTPVPVGLGLNAAGGRGVERVGCAPPRRRNVLRARGQREAKRGPPGQPEEGQGEVFHGSSSRDMVCEAVALGVTE